VFKTTYNLEDSVVGGTRHEFEEFYETLWLCMSRHLAIDIGASGGKAFVGEFDGESFTLAEVNRFPNGPVEIGGRLRWDMVALIEGVRESIRTALDYEAYGLDSIGIDTWGVDFGFVDEEGNLTDEPFAYRDPGVSSTVEEVHKLIPRRELFNRTGIQHLSFNTIFQLHSYFKGKSGTGHTGKMLLMPGLLTYLAGGSAAVDGTIASTTQLIDIMTGGWAFDLAERLNIPKRIFPEIVPAGTVAGDLGGPIGVGLSPWCRIIHTAGHDTASAVAAFDFAEEDAAYLSTGTWFLGGCLSDKPLVGDEAYKAGLTNERGADGRFRLLKNITGLYGRRRGWRPIRCGLWRWRRRLERSGRCSIRMMNH
jgi:rhamnulokinase